jgi:hypothetical protein
MSMTALCIENPRGLKRPKWQRSALLTEDRTIFEPAAMSGNEMAATWDGGVLTCGRIARHVFRNR